MEIFQDRTTPGFSVSAFPPANQSGRSRCHGGDPLEPPPAKGPDDDPPEPPPEKRSAWIRAFRVSG